MAQNVFTRENQTVLQKFLESKVLIAFDYDGTLAPIVNEPQNGFMMPGTIKLLNLVAESYPVVIISGRARDDVMKFVSKIPLLETIGNHGIEPWGSTQKIKNQIIEIKANLSIALSSLQGIIMEDKIYSLSIHYRLSKSKKNAIREILKVLNTISSIRIVGGKQVINVIPKDGPHKGMALLKAMKKFDCHKSVYLGDDVTDEDVFNLDSSKEIFGIKVGKKLDTAAKYYITKQTSIDKFLQLLLKLQTYRSRSIMRKKKRLLKPNSADIK